MLLKGEILHRADLPFQLTNIIQELNYNARWLTAIKLSLSLSLSSFTSQGKEERRGPSPRRPLPQLSLPSFLPLGSSEWTRAEAPPIPIFQWDRALGSVDGFTSL